MHWCLWNPVSFSSVLRCFPRLPLSMLHESSIVLPSKCIASCYILPSSLSLSLDSNYAYSTYGSNWGEDMIYGQTTMRVLRKGLSYLSPGEYEICANSGRALITNGMLSESVAWRCKTLSLV
jgi:hypothetical protein